MEFLEILGLAAGICTSSSLLPQLIKTVKTKEAQDVSVFMFIVMLTGNSLWIYYGFAKSDFPIISTNFLALGLNIAMLVFKYKYRHN
ncbi:SemiSWEET transporter [Chitinophaga filiformis]|uniref:SemiSWEET family sugar transporter n=1 Tax=Chitinophaga filiformis TaxID=104663 RepID=UPI001F40E801|nr:SemiSWEET transporter [Chitinophaga filiformis]MCF6405108.1 SemiSWEET transporter [Chitinophaga filiformis]